MTKLQDAISKLPAVLKAHVYEPKIEDVAKVAFEVGRQEGVKIGIVSGGKDISLLSKAEMESRNSLAESYLESVKQEGRQKVVEYIEKRRNACRLNTEEFECRLCLSELLESLKRSKPTRGD